MGLVDRVGVDLKCLLHVGLVDRLDLDRLSCVDHMGLVDLVDLDLDHFRCV